MNYKLTITKRADELIDQIIYYLINQLNNPLAAVIPHFDYVIIFRIDEAAMCVYIVGFFHDLECYMNKLE